MFRWSLVSLFVGAVAVVNANSEDPQQRDHHQLHFLAPHPLAGQVVATEDMVMMATMLGHYGKPPSECLPDELAFQISGVPGMVRDVFAHDRHVVRNCMFAYEMTPPPPSTTY